ncbi:branched-chain amino acid ABC transporter permease [Aminobacter aminovorans]|uniref:Branched-chain amino acid transport system permease protein n=1 Tax=Aminobacter aminovorans TaxID=83263 RepID=A0AAC8YVW2_AMIAI|nr:branched-chain amino acid ABC transporter permease [Aminobacter aminovorans]AMS45457.1 High-affinity branched-chain amino acid ABC transporter permease protein [Aminobacter aminovorans]MBB3708664.1 branched-chain amino acid transport system permease protein [Aminobacter aminovorans]
MLFTSRNLAPLIFSLACVAAVSLVAWLWGSNYAQQVVTEMMIRLMVVAGLYIFMGNSGIISFGHVGFMAIGAYGAAWLTCCTLPMMKPMSMPGLPLMLQGTAYPLWAGIVVSITLSMVVAIVFGAIILRLSSLAASIATFGFLVIINNIYSNWDSVTTGTSSLANIPVDIGVGTAAFGACVVILLAFLHQRSRYGVMLRATRDELVASRASGVPVLRVRLIAFVLSAACIGAAGGFYSSSMGVLSISTFYISLTFLTLAMLTVGGASALSGAVLGVLFLTAISEAFRFFEKGISVGGAHLILPSGAQEVALGIVMIVVLVIWPSGLVRGEEVSFRRLLSRR